VKGLMVAYVLERKVQERKQSHKIIIENGSLNPKPHDSRFADRRLNQRLTGGSREIFQPVHGDPL